MSFFINDALAQGAEGGQAGTLELILPLLLMFGIFYFLLIRPQMKRAKEHRKLVADLAVGDEIVTNGGLLGRISKVGESFVTVELSDSVEIKVQRHAVSSIMPKGTIKSA